MVFDLVWVLVTVVLLRTRHTRTNLTRSPDLLRSARARGPEVQVGAGDVGAGAVGPPGHAL